MINGDDKTGKKDDSRGDYYGRVLVQGVMLSLCIMLKKVFSFITLVLNLTWYFKKNLGN